MSARALGSTCLWPPNTRHRRTKKNGKKGLLFTSKMGPWNISCMHAVCVKCLSARASNAPDVDNAGTVLKIWGGREHFPYVMTPYTQQEREREKTGGIVWREREKKLGHEKEDGECKAGPGFVNKGQLFGLRKYVPYSLWLFAFVLAFSNVAAFLICGWCNVDRVCWCPAQRER